jgi:hypothetical protein
MVFPSFDCDFFFFNCSLLGLDNLPDLEDLETKLNAYYAKVEKDTGLSKGYVVLYT